jgi:hypothetical protein
LSHVLRRAGALRVHAACRLAACTHQHTPAHASAPH